MLWLSCKWSSKPFSSRPHARATGADLEIMRRQGMDALPMMHGFVWPPKTTAEIPFTMPPEQRSSYDGSV